MNTAQHINEFNTVLVRYTLIIKGKSVTKASYFETKEEALDWALSTEQRCKVMGVDFDLTNAEVANQEPKFWDIRKDFWNYRAAAMQAKKAANQ